MTISRSLLPLLAIALATGARAQFVETEDNNTKATANAFAFGPGSTITGRSTGNLTVSSVASVDFFRLNLAATSRAIYRDQIRITTLGTKGHIGQIRGLRQIAGVVQPGTDTEFQGTTYTTDTRYNQFYTFGAATSLYFKVEGQGVTNADYTVALTRSVVQPIDLGSFAAGTITFNTGTTSTQDTSLLILDADLNPIADYANDDSPTALNGGTSTGSSYLSRIYAPGTYTLAISSFGTKTSLASAPDDLYRGGPVLDFAGVLANPVGLPGANTGFTVADANGVRSVAGTQVADYDVNFYRFTVTNPVPEPATLAALGLGALALLRRRRAG